jgi:hypothetical protein
MNNNPDPNAESRQLIAVFESLGKYSSLVAETLAILHATGKRNNLGKEYKRHSVYEVINGQRSNADIENAFLLAAETEIARREATRERAAKVLAKVTA